MLSHLRRSNLPARPSVGPTVLVAARGDIGGAERVMLLLLEHVPVGDAVVCAPRGSDLAAAVEAMGHPVRHLELHKLVNSSSLWSYAAEYLQALKSLVAVLRTERASVVHGVAAFTLKVVIPAAVLTHVPAVIGVQEITTPDAIGWLRSRAQRLLAAPRAASFAAASAYVAETLISSGYPADRVHVVRAGIVRSAPRVPREESRAALDLPSEAVLFLVVARLSWWKGVHVAIDAFARYCDRVSAPALLLVVGGPAEPGDEEYEGSLHAQVISLGLDDRIRFFGPRSDVERFYDACDVVLVPSVRPDPFPTVVLEAGVAGRAAVVTAMGGAKEALVDGVTGIVAEPTVEEFASAMERSVEAAWHVEAGKAAQAHVEGTLDSASFAASIKALWKAAASGQTMNVPIRSRIRSRAR